MPIILLLIIIPIIVILVLAVVEYLLNLLINAIPGAKEGLAGLAGLHDTWWWDFWWEYDALGIPHPSGRFAFVENLWEAFFYRGINFVTGEMGSGTRSEPAKFTILWFIKQIKGFIIWLGDKIAEVLESFNITIGVQIAQIIAIGIIVLAGLAVLYALWRLIV